MTPPMDDSIPPIILDNQGLPLQFVAIDYHFLILYKPPNMLSVQARSPHLGVSLFAQLRAHFPEVRCVHRLDYETSGIMVFARGKRAERLLFEQFRNRRVQKKYWAICHQPPADREGDINLPLGKTDISSPYQLVDWEKGKSAITHWKQRAEFNQLWLAELHPITGRTHQLRVHLSEIGSPIVNDPLYGPQLDPLPMEERPRMYLHAADIGFDHPDTGVPLSFSVLPEAQPIGTQPVLWTPFLPLMTASQHQDSPLDAPTL